MSDEVPYHDHDDIYVQNRTLDTETHRIDKLDKRADQMNQRLQALEDVIQQDAGLTGMVNSLRLELDAVVEKVERIRRLTLGHDRRLQSFMPWSADVTKDINAISDVVRDFGKVFKQHLETQDGVNHVLMYAIASPQGRVELLTELLADAVAQAAKQE
jgi:hypothetical protein